MEVAAERLNIPCFSPRKALFSISSPFKRGLATLEVRERAAVVNRLVVSVSSAVLRLQEPVDSACRPILQMDTESSEDENGEDDCKGSSNSFEDDKTLANSNPGRTIAGFGDHDNISDGVSCECRSSNGALFPGTNATGSSRLDERERLRRERIGIANKGKTPWNKGKCHSPETIARIRQSSKLVMQNPQMRAKLRQYSHPQSEETREKIRKFMKLRMDFERRQLTIVQEWKDFIAIMAKKGMVGDNELQWDSYQILKKTLQRQYYADKKEKQKDRGPKVLAHAHRLRISESIKAKWADSQYRNRIVQKIQEKRQKGPRVRKSNFIDPEFDLILDSFASTSNCSFHESRFHPDAKVGIFNDPLSKEKLKKIKLLRLQNTARKEAQFKPETRSELVDLKGEKKTDILQESKEKAMNVKAVAIHKGASGQGVNITSLHRAQHEAAERARILLAEAEQAAIFAAQALDAAGACDEMLNDSLFETWTLLDEASKFISTSKVNKMSR